MDTIAHPDLPIGFGFALAQNPEAMQAFARLSEAGQNEIVQRARTVSSRNEMQALVNELSSRQ